MATVAQHALNNVLAKPLPENRKVCSNPREGVTSATLQLVRNILTLIGATEGYIPEVGKVVKNIATKDY